jgi:TonB family protein
MLKYILFSLFLLSISCSSNKFINYKLFHTSTDKTSIELSSIYNDVTYLKDIEIEEFVEKLENVSQQKLVIPIDTIGIVGLVCVIDKKGSIESVYKFNSLHPKLDSLCLEALMQSKFKPYSIKQSKAEKYYFKIRYPFTSNKFYPPNISFRYMKFSHYTDKQGNIIKVYDFNDLDEKPNIIYNAIPVYPDEARKKEIEGMVGITAIVDENGNIIDATLLQSIHYSLDKEAIKKIYECKFTPGYKNGEKVKVRMNVPFSFKLK